MFPDQINLRFLRFALHRCKRLARDTRALGPHVLWEFLAPRAAPPPDTDEFDRTWGVETAANVALYDLAIDSPNELLGGRYAPSPGGTCRKLLDELPIVYEDFTFVDLGAGKGRVLITAAQFPFRRVIGVEFAPELVARAEQNLRACGDLLACKQVEMVSADAADYLFPDTDLVIYLFNPFESPVLDRVLQNVQQSLRLCPRTVYCLYYAPFYMECFQKHPSLVQVGNHDGARIYTNHPAPSSLAIA